MMGVINEFDKKRIWLLRRLSTMVQDYLEEEVFTMVDIISPCGYATSEDYLNEIIEVLVSNFISKFSENLYDEDDVLEIDKFVWQIISDKYSDYIINQFDGRVCDEDNYDDEY